ncbi:DUF2147 domain-containing protein [Mesorhizobium marinum]|uniref:DUF2147 domain-containing protein n=1 Tax=Mesorhizobium marinum TaxID=3228790 RepID=A0ABV3R0I3_9HYPH
MFRRLSLAGLAMIAATGLACADPIEGNWKTEAGSTARISACGSGFCIKLISGTHSGKQIGTMAASGSGYTGTITDPANDKTYKGKASIAGGILKMSGCVLGGLICQSQNWNRM